MRWPPVELVEEVVDESANRLKVKLPEVNGEYELTCSTVLVQAFGTCCGVNFYFRAKHGEYEFETEDEGGHLYPVGDARHLILRDTYDEAKPGAMSVDWAARILRRCLSKWWSS